MYTILSQHREGYYGEAYSLKRDNICEENNCHQSFRERSAPKIAIGGTAPEGIPLARTDILNGANDGRVSAAVPRVERVSHAGVAFRMPAGGR